MNIPENLRYSTTHEWVRFDGSKAYVGITDYAQSNLGDIVFVELPEVGARFEVGAEAGTIESVKAVSPIFSPVAGSVVEINSELEGAPERVNSDPYASWFFTLEIVDPHAADSLLDAEAYQKICE